MPAGVRSWAAVAAPPSPLKPGAPLPATVLMTPPGVILRMRWLPQSARNRFPLASNATEDGADRLAAVAGPPSPLNPAVPVPAMVVMIPPGVILRMRLLP